MKNLPWLKDKSEMRLFIEVFKFIFTKVSYLFIFHRLSVFKI